MDRIGCLNPAFSGAQKWAEMLHHPCIHGDPQTKGDKIRIGCLNPAFRGAHKWAEMLRHPCFLGDPQQRGQNQSTKKAKKKKKKSKKFPMVSVILPIVLQTAPTGVQTQDHAVAEALLYPRGYGPSLTHLCTGVVFIFGPIWFSSIIAFSSKKLSILSIDTWVENPFYHPRLVQANFP